MLESVKISRRQSEIRQDLSALVGKETPTEDETRSIEKLDMEFRSNETRFRAALTLENEERNEAKGELETRSDRDYSSLLDKFELRQVALHLDEGRSLDGATAEVVQEMRNAGGYRGVPVPLEALEQRSTVSSGTPNPVNTRNIFDRLFPASIASRLGVQAINIAQGSESFPVATSGATAGWAATEGGDVPNATAFATAEASLTPDNTLGAHMRITRKAMKQTGAGLEAAIRRDMAAAFGAELDRATLLGSGTAGQPLGVITGASTYSITDTDMSAADPTWSMFKTEIIAFMAANAITDPSMIKLALTPAIWGAMDDDVWDAGSGVTEWDRLVKHVGAGNIMTGNQLTVGSAIMTTNAGGVAPAYVGLWGGVDLIRDVTSDAQSGGLRLTGLITADVTVARGAQTRVLSNFG